MKKILTILGAAMMAMPLFAQGPADAILFSRSDYEGSARTISMGNAFTALGGDVGAISINPAASGLYRYMEFSITPGLLNTGAKTTYFGNTYKDSGTRGVLSSAGFVAPIFIRDDGGTFSINIGFTANRIKSFDSNIAAYGYNSNTTMLGSIAASIEGVNQADLTKTDTYEPYLDSDLPWNAILAWDCYGINPREDLDNSYIAATEYLGSDGYPHMAGTLFNIYEAHTTGGIQEFSCNLGLNIHDNFYLGANINLHSVDYTLDEYFSEEASTDAQTLNSFMSMTSNYWQRTTGSGLNVKFGAIYAPTTHLRFGFTYQTPTWYTLTDNWQRSMQTSFVTDTYYNTSPIGNFTYTVKSPGRWGLGAAFVGSSTIFSFDYERANYGKMRMADENNNTIPFSYDNTVIQNSFKSAGSLRLGFEQWIGNTALRLGYARHSSPGTLSNYTYPKLRYFSCGMGFLLGKSVTLDLAYQRCLSKQDYSFECFEGYDGMEGPVAYVNWMNVNKFLVSVAIRF